MKSNDNNIIHRVSASPCSAPECARPSQAPSSSFGDFFAHQYENWELNNPPNMSFTPNFIVKESYPPMNASRPQAISAAAPRMPPSILTYSYNSKLVYVTPAETYEVRFCSSPNSAHLLTTSESSKPSTLPKRHTWSSEMLIAV